MSPRRLWAALESPSRRTRERAWRVQTDRWLADAPVFDDLWHTLRRVRGEMAATAGAETYSALRRRELRALAVGKRAQLAVEEFVTSVLVRLHERRRREFGVRTIRPWDLLAAPPGLPTDLPFETRADVSRALTESLHRACPECERSWELSTAGPEPLASDAQLVQVLGAYGRAWVERESGETSNLGAAVAGLLVLHADADAAKGAAGTTSWSRMRIRHLERVLLGWTFGAMIDAFEDRAYAHPEEVTAGSGAGATWASLWLRFLPAVDWTGLEESLAAEWHRHDALFLHPCESMELVAAEVRIFGSWTQVANRGAWLQGLGPLGEQSSGAHTLDENDVHDVSRWIEDTIENLERTTQREVADVDGLTS